MSYQAYPDHVAALYGNSFALGAYLSSADAAKLAQLSREPPHWVPPWASFVGEAATEQRGVCRCPMGLRTHRLVPVMKSLRRRERPFSPEAFDSIAIQGGRLYQGGRTSDVASLYRATSATQSVRVTLSVVGRRK